MFGHRFFGVRFYGNRYFGQTPAGAGGSIPAGGSTGNWNYRRTRFS